MMTSPYTLQETKSDHQVSKIIKIDVCVRSSTYDLGEKLANFCHGKILFIVPFPDLLVCSRFDYNNT